MTPSAKMSVRWSTGRPDTCSGDMYGIVPITAPACVSACETVASGSAPASVTFASPKSSTLTRQSAATITLAGLRSRWTMPRSWAAVSASARAVAMPTIRSTGSPSAGMIRSSDCPSTSCMVRKWTPSPSSTE